MIGFDKGTETGTLATLHAFLRRHHQDMDPIDTVIYCPSTDNQVSSLLVFIIFWKQVRQIVIVAQT